MEKLLKIIDGNKTYIISGLAIIGIIIEAQGITIPTYVWQVLAVFGLGAVRSAMKKLEI